MARLARLARNEAAATPEPAVDAKPPSGFFDRLFGSKKP